MRSLIPPNIRLFWFFALSKPTLWLINGGSSFLMWFKCKRESWEGIEDTPGYTLRGWLFSKNIWECGNFNLFWNTGYKIASWMLKNWRTWVYQTIYHRGGEDGDFISGKLSRLLHLFVRYRPVFARVVAHIGITSWLFPLIPFQYRAFTYTQTHQNGEKWAKFIKNGKKSEFIEAWAQVKAEHDFIFIYQLRFKGSVPLRVVGGPFQPCNYSIVTLGIFFIWIVLKSCKGEAKYYSWN